jgi:CheY-like chemotaxis protein
MLESLPSLTGHVLIVDDIKDIRNLMGFICASFGLETSFAINGEHAITKIVEAQEQTNQFDAILMDIHMPVLDGKRAILQLREMGITAPIIAVTAATMKGVHKELKSLGFNDVVAKPVDKHGLYQALSRCLKKQTLAESTTQTSVQTSALSSTQSSTQPTLAITESVNAKHFLIIEDDKDAAQITALLLNSLNIKTTITHSAAEALPLFTSNTHNASSPAYDRILLDINLPDANGLELSKEIRELSPASKITIISGNDISAKVLLDFSIDQALLKPINLDMLKNLA